MIYTKQQIVGSTQVGADTNLSTLGLFGMVESAITECMGTQHIDGMTIKRLYNAFWVFTKNKVKIFANAVWGDMITIESYVSSKSAAKLYVDTAIKSSDGQIIAYSSCEMCPLDVATGRILRTSAVGVGEHIVSEPAQIEVVFDKLDCDNLPVVEQVTVRSTNIDFSHHTNNVEYLRFIFNTYSVEELLSRPIRELEVNYVSQSYENDVLSVCKSTTDTCDLFTITKFTQTVIKCKVVR
ncbi:MAG: hypothetical protein J1F66_05605 [Clostridiales bacterium]|nr:hypothetical protein [Clostridiales bacterium]